MRFWRKKSGERSAKQEPGATGEEALDAANDRTGEVALGKPAADGRALLAAIAEGSVAKVQGLLDSGADIENAGAAGTPLAFAATNGKLPIVKLLLERGADANCRDQDGNTPLHNVAWEGWKEVAQLLIQHGAAIDAANDAGQTPLMVAQVAGNTIIAAILKEAADNRAP